MYITITPQKNSGSFSQSVADYVNYLEKENEGLSLSEQETFFNQYENTISKEIVIDDIDKNTSKLSKKEPKFYAITISPSASELKALKNPSDDLRAYTREAMKKYVESFNREIQGRKITIDDIKYYAKVEHKRYYKGTDRAVQQNQAIASEVLKLKHQLRAVEKTGNNFDKKQIIRRIEKLESLAPHKLNGQRIKNGMEKPGLQTHIHIIVSRKDASNSVSLSPGSKYKASDVEFQGKMVKRGFNRDKFFSEAEKVFDKKFGFQRNYSQRYESRKLLTTNSKMYYKAILGLPQNEKALAMKAIAKMGVSVPTIPTNKVQLALKTIKAIKKGAAKVIKSSSIGI